MERASSERLGEERRTGRVIALGVLVVGGVLGVCLLPNLAFAQGESKQAPRCRIVSRDAAEPAVAKKQLMALCGERGVLLGAADEFQVSSHDGLQAMVVDMRHGSTRHVLLISLQSEGSPMLEDISGQISMAAGLGPMSSLEGLDIDIADFARSGLIGVRGAPDRAARSSGADTIDLGQQIALVRASRGARLSEDSLP